MFCVSTQQIPMRSQIRVFVSSTFRDMQPERDHLVKFIFPRLRKLCESRGVTWGEVDLRWGVTEEQSAQGKVLSLCLQEIHRCRPYFIGLLGELYGQSPKEISEDLANEHPWLLTHRGKSYTELEIIFGVLREPSMHGHAYFYFRSAEAFDALPAEKRSLYKSESPEAAQKVANLKRLIRNARDEQVCQLRESYQDVKQLGEWVSEDFTKLIDALFPA